MHDWEFLVTGRVIVRAHCQHDAEEAAMDAARDVLLDVDSIELLQMNGRIRIVKDNA
jgi:hypothetical protein